MQIQEQTKLTKQMKQPGKNTKDVFSVCMTPGPCLFSDATSLPYLAGIKPIRTSSNVVGAMWKRVSFRTMIDKPVMR